MMNAKHLNPRLLTVLFLAFGAFFSGCSEKPEAVSLFDGKSLEGWHAIPRLYVPSNEEFDKIIQDKNNLNLGLENKLLIPAIERHVLALAKLRKAIFDERQEIIFDNYVQQIFFKVIKEY